MKHVIAFFLISTLCFGCVRNSQHPFNSGVHSNPPTRVNWEKAPPPPTNRALVAIAGFENKSTYAADKIWDTSAQFLFTQLLNSRYFRIVEWEKMKRLFDWKTLSQLDIIKSPEKMKNAEQILLCDHFISGTLTRYNISTYAKTSAISKAKVIDTTIRVDLLLQNAKTGEYMAAGKGEHTIRQTIKSNQIGTWNSQSGDLALDLAIEKALFNLIKSHNLQTR